MQLKVLASVVLLGLLQFIIPATAYENRFAAEHYKQAHLTSRCQSSEFGVQACLRNLQVFVLQHGEEPLSDDEMLEVFGCIGPANGGAGQTNNRLHQQPSIPGC